MDSEYLYTLYKKHPIICTDTRHIIKGSIFFALKGKNFNGNLFAKNAIELGCSFAVIDEKKFAVNKSYILVEDVLNSLQKLAELHRKKLSIPVIGITGSNGKTTSKELIASVLNRKYRISYTKGNLNNHIGVPLSVLQISKDDEIAIIEMGANHIGEIASLCNIAKPNFGVITNIGKAHLEGFGGISGVIIAKSELYKSIETKKEGLLFVNKDDSTLMNLSDKIKRVTYGKNGDVAGKVVQEIPFLSLEVNGERINSNLIGSYQFYNILLAFTVGVFFKVPREKIISSIEKYIPKNNRSQIINTEYNKIILDAYNANPTSMEETLIYFCKYKERKICILGDMLELGFDSKKEHKRIMNLTKQLGLKSLFVGKEFSKASNKDGVYKNNDCLKENLKKIDIKNTLILIKGSRGLMLEELIEFL